MLFLPHSQSRKKNRGDIADEEGYEEGDELHSDSQHRNYTSEKKCYQIFQLSDSRVQTLVCKIPKNTYRGIYKPVILEQTSVSPLRWMDPEMDPTKPENDSQSKNREQTVQTSDSQPLYNLSITFHSLQWPS